MVATVLELLLLLVGPGVAAGSVTGGLLVVGPGAVSPHDGGADDSDTAVSKADGVALGVLGGVLLGVDERGDDTTAVTDRDNDGSGDRLLERTTRVVVTPGSDDGDEGVDTGGGEEETKVVDVLGDTSEEENVADGADGGAKDDEETTLLGLV